MTIAQDFIKKLQNATEKDPLPKKFWEDFSSDIGIPTFQDVLDKYAEYYSGLSQPQKKEMSKIFWEQVKDFGTPIVEERPDGQSEVYFLFHRDKLSDSTEGPGTKKELYLQGDFHGYGSTLKETQELLQLPGTDVMCRSNTMPKDSLVTYYYVQLEPKHGNKQATHFYGDVAYRPPAFFPVKLSKLPADKPPTKTQEELEAADTLFNDPQSVLIDEFSKYHKMYAPRDSFFCADPNKEVSYLVLPAKDNSIWDFLSDLEKKARVCLVSKDDEVMEYPSNSTDLSKFSRSIHVFAPPGEDGIEQVVIMSDGKFYQLGNTVERLDRVLSEKTAVIFISAEEGILKEAAEKGVEFEATDALAGMELRTIDFKYRIDEYADFIHNKLLPALVDRGIKIPDDPNKRVLVGASLSGTASLYMGITHPEWFGKIVAQSPSIANRGLLEEMIANGTKPPSTDIFLSCGEFESPQYAKNLNIPFAEELAGHLGIMLHRYYHGHQMEGWSPQLEEALPALGFSIKASTLPLEVAREISHQYKGVLQDAKTTSAEEHKAPSPFQTTLKPSDDS